MRIGIGYDIHRFNGPGPVRLGGVTVPSPHGLEGHSDADVLLHAIADAVFGAIGAPDLGEQFPPSDPRFRGADSRSFVRAAVAQAARAGLRVGNLDATVITDTPRLVGQKPRIARAIAQLLGVGERQVSVKAKTTEGFSPAEGGIAAQAVVLLESVKTNGRTRPAATRRSTGRDSRPSRRLRGARSSPSPRRATARRPAHRKASARSR